MKVTAWVCLFLVSACVSDDQLITRQLLNDAQRRRDRGVPLTATLPATPIPPTASPSPSRTPRPGRTLATVRRVWDGNTILLDGGNSVRYIGVDTPGAGMFRRPLEPFGRDAAERNLALVEGKEVELEPDVDDVDSAGMLLRYVYVDNIMVNENLLRSGLARLGETGGNNRHDQLLRRAEADARRFPVNIWTLVTPSPTITPSPTQTATSTLTPLATSTRRPTLTPPGTLTPLRFPGVFPPTLTPGPLPPTPPRSPTRSGT